MNIPLKVLKANSSPPSQMFNNHQGLAKKYYQIFKKKIQSNQSPSNKIELDREKEKKNLQCSQEEAIKWFFSLDLKQRLKVCSIENKWLVTIIYQMCKHTLLDERIKFQMSFSFNKENSEDLLPSLIYTNNSITASLINVNLNNLQNLSINDTNGLNNYLNYFSPTNYAQTNINIEKFLNLNEKMERGLFRELKFFQKNEMNDTITLSLGLISDENLFRQFFSYFTNDKYFKNIIQVVYDGQNKFYNFNFPAWVNGNEYYSFFQWVIAFFEQNILIWYFLSKNLSSKIFDALLQDDKTNEIFEENEKMIKFLKNHSFSTINDKKKFLNKINFKNISIEIRKDEKIAEMISLKRKYADIVNQVCSNNIIYFQNVDKRTVLEILEDAENKIKEQFYLQSEEAVIEFLFFSTLDKIFSYDDVMNKKIWGEVHNIFTNQNALDLIMEEILLSKHEFESNSPKRLCVNNASDGNKKSKNVKKNKNNVKRYSKEDNPNEECIKKPDVFKTDLRVKGKNLNGDLESLKPIAGAEDIVTKTENKTHEENRQDEKSNFAYCNKDELNINKTTESTVKTNKNVIKQEKKSFFLYSTTKKSVNKENLLIKSEVKLNSIESSTSNTKKEIDSHNNKNTSGEDKIITNTKSELEVKNMTIEILEESMAESSNQACDKNKEKVKRNENKNIITDKSKDDCTTKSTMNLNENNGSNLNITINNPIYNNFYIVDSNYAEQQNKLICNNDIKNEEAMYFPSKQIDSPINKECSSAIKSTNAIPRDHMVNNNYRVANNTSTNNFYAPGNMANNSSVYTYPNPFANGEIYKKINQLNLLHNNIVSYSKEVSENITKLKEIKLSIVRKVEEIIKTNLNEYEINFSIFGSFATDLAIECSDIDLTVNYWPKEDERFSSINKQKVSDCNTELIINKIVNILKQTNKEHKCKIFDLINPIYTATVPVIKLHIDIAEILSGHEKIFFEDFQSSKNYSNFKYKIEELDKVKIDLTFNQNKQNLMNNLNIYENPALQAVEYIKNSLVFFPEIKLIMFVVKRILKITKLNSSYNGGLSSFCLFILTSAFLKMRKLNMNMIISPNLGSLLIEFLEFYAKFNFNFNFIDLNSFNPFVYVIDGLDQIPLILDPVTYLNAGKNTFRIHETQKCFRYIINLFHSNSLDEPDLVSSLLEDLKLYN